MFFYRLIFGSNTNTASNRNLAPSIPQFNVTGIFTTDSETAKTALKFIQSVFANNDFLLHAESLGHICNMFFLALDKQYNLTKKTENQFEATAKDIVLTAQKLLGKEKALNIGFVLQNIRVKGGNIDTKTRLNVMLLLVKTWELTSQFPTTDAKNMIVYNLYQDKINPYSEIATRLIQPYCVLLRHSFLCYTNVNSNNNNLRSPTYTPQSSTDNNVDIQIEYEASSFSFASELSLSFPSPSAKQMEYV